MSKYEFEKIEVSSYLDVHSSSKSIEEHYLADFKADEELYKKIKSLRLSNAEVKNGIIEILDYRADHQICKKCPGLVKCPKENAGYCFDLEKEDGRLIKTVTQCERWLKRNKVSSQFIYRDYPTEWSDCAFSALNIDVTKDRASLIMAAKSILDDKKSKWLYVKSSHGSGATYLLTCFANSYAEKKEDRIAFCETTKLLDELKGLKINDKKGFEEKMDLLTSCGCLILDGFGNEQKTDFALSSLLYPLLEKRASLNKLTIFASNFSLDEIASMYAMKVSSERAEQLKELIHSKVGKSFALNGMNVYGD